MNVGVGRPYDDAAHAGLVSLFAEAHQREFGHIPPADTPIELVNLRVAAVGILERPSLPLLEPLPAAAPRRQRRGVALGLLPDPEARKTRTSALLYISEVIVITI